MLLGTVRDCRGMDYHGSYQHHLTHVLSAPPVTAHLNSSIFLTDPRNASLDIVPVGTQSPYTIGNKAILHKCYLI